ncbi:hypothetical protein DSECCO2_557540 [anaerobic digester metagenome]
MTTMNWIEPKIESIITTDVIFYSKEYADTSVRICETLGLDVMPDASGESYWQYKNEKWTPNPIMANQKIDIQCDIFDQDVLENMEFSPSNILFCFDNDEFKGILHFTNYNVRHVYQALYQNLFNFETSLRNHLNTFGFNIQSFKDYFQYQLTKRKTKHYVDRFNDFKDEKFLRSAEQVGIMQKLELRDLLRFSVSSWLNSEIKNKIGLSGIDSEKIGDLRNIIMHSKNFIGESANEDYNFQAFKNFFSKILLFQAAFSKLSNVSILRQLESLDDQQLKSYFYNRI